MKQKKKAPYGDKTIKITVALWTNGKPRGHAYDTGAIYMRLNRLDVGLTCPISTSNGRNQVA